MGEAYSLEQSSLHVGPAVSCPGPRGTSGTGLLQGVTVPRCRVSQVRNIRKVLRNMDKPFGLYPNFLSPVSGNWVQREYWDAASPNPRATQFPPQRLDPVLLGKSVTLVSESCASWAFTWGSRLPPTLPGTLGLSLCCCRCYGDKYDGD